jgi:hypothetical protein
MRSCDEPNFNGVAAATPAGIEAKRTVMRSPSNLLPATQGGPARGGDTMGDNESDLTLTEAVDLRSAGVPAPLMSRAWAALSAWESEDVLVGLLLVPIAVAVGGILALTMLFTLTLFAPVLAAWFIWLAFRSIARNRLPPPVRRSAT